MTCPVMNEAASDARNTAAAAAGGEGILEDNYSLWRLMERENISEEYARVRIAAQRSNAEFSGMCDYTLENDGTYQDFQRKCLAFFSDPAIMKEKP